MNWKAVLIAVGMMLLSFKLNNIIPSELNLPVIILVVGLIFTFVYLSRIFIEVSKGDLLSSALVACGIVLFIMMFVDPGVFGITNEVVYVQVPGTESILSFVLEDIVGIPLWVIGLTFLAFIIFLFINPLLAVGLFLILLGVALFFITPGMLADDIVSAGIGILMSIAGVVKGKKSAPRGIPRAPVIYNIDLDK